MSNFFYFLFFSIGSAGKVVSAGVLFSRIAVSLLMIPHGYEKIIHFQQLSSNYEPAFISPMVSLILAIFTQFFCSCFLIIGFLGRFSLIMLMINTALIIFYQFQSGINYELYSLYFTVYFLLFSIGIGRFSMDSFVKR